MAARYFLGAHHFSFWLVPVDRREEWDRYTAQSDEREGQQIAQIVADSGRCPPDLELGLPVPAWAIEVRLSTLTFESPSMDGSGPNR